MEENNKKKIQNEELLSEADLERLQLLQRSHEKKGNSLLLMVSKEA